jgi:hypothetical protein
MPEETVVTPASLNNAQRGQLAELIFIRKAASLGFAVAKPWNEGERYDAIVRVETPALAGAGEICAGQILFAPLLPGEDYRKP